MKARLMSAAALAMLFAVAGAQAQTDQGGNGEQQLPSAQGGDMGGGACPPDQCPPGGAGEAPDAAVMPSEGAPAETMPDQAQGTDQQIPPEGQAAGQPQPGDEQPADQAAGGEGQSGAPEEVQTGQQAKPDEPATTGSTDAVEIDDQQASVIRETVHEVRVDPAVDIDFDINIGIAVPGTVILHPLPPRIVEIVPAYSGYQFFVLADGTIIIVDPGTLHIVYVLYA